MGEDMTEPLKIHFTEEQTLLRCSREWYDSYYLERAPIARNRSMDLGSAFHLMKQAYLSNLYVDEVVDLSQLDDNARNILPKIFDVWRRWYEAQGIEHLQVEQSLTVPLLDGQVLFSVTPDGIIKWRDELWCDETKTAAQFDERKIHLDLQGRVQMLVAHDVGIDVSGVLYTQVRTTDPATARVDVLRAFPIRFPEGALRDAAITVEVMAQRIVDYREMLSIGMPQEAIDRIFIRAVNPLGFMACFCPFEAACIASWSGREEAALDDLYQKKEVRK